MRVGTEHSDFMREAIQLAQFAEQQGEVPCGAVVVKDNQIVGKGFNQVITANDPSAHAEMIAIREAGKLLGNYRLVDCSLYVTLEPCPMCSGLLVHSRIDKLFFGAYDAKTGAAGSVMDICRNNQLNHRIDVVGGLLERECSELLSAFFKKRREQKRLEKMTGKDSA